jgi:hypothetical protein
VLKCTMQFQLFTNQGHFTAAVNGRLWPLAAVQSGSSENRLKPPPKAERLPILISVPLRFPLLVIP